VSFKKLENVSDSKNNKKKYSIHRQGKFGINEKA